MTEDSAIQISPSAKLKSFITDHLKDLEGTPERIKVLANANPTTALRKRGGKSALSIPNQSDMPLLCVEDFNWLYSQVKILREKGDPSSSTYLHKLLEGCEIVLPQPPVIERNPELEARIQRLKKEQEEREYKAMTKNVDNVRVRHPDDSIGYQMKMMNSHIIAVVQFIVSVGAGFTFGFVGIQLMVGSLDFGFRLLLGVACALVIALAEIYFLAKKLSEDYDEAPLLKHEQIKSKNLMSTNTSGKQHKD